MKTLLIFFLIFVCFFCEAQNENSSWCFGDSAGIDFKNVNNPQPFNTSVQSRGSCGSISDSLGNLLFYAFNKTVCPDTSTFIFTSSNDSMDNGKNLNGAHGYNQIVLLESPNGNNIYYMIYSGRYSVKGLYYAIIDMTQNNGLGKVILRDQPLISNKEMGDCTQAIQHGNGRDWWVINKPSQMGSNKNRFYIWKLDTSGFSPYTTTDFNNATDATFQKIIFNNNGDKLMLINFGGFMAEYDFDRCTGIISNEKIIFPELHNNYNRYFWEGAYSSNDSLFYVTTEWITGPSDTSRLLQYNLFATDIPASCDTLFEIKYPVIIGAVRLAPDNKIYMASTYQSGFPAFPYQDSVRNMYNENLGVINYPDSIGAACNFQPFSFNLGGKRVYAGLPNNPNYSLGRLVGSPCDTLQWVGTPETPNPLQGGLNAGFIVKPNPFLNSVTISIVDFKNENWELKIFDVMGKEVLQQKIVREKTDLDLRYLNRGIYFVMVYDGRSIFTEKVVKL